MQTGIDVLKAVKREWTPDRYVKGVLARNSYGASVNPDDQNAVKFCASGVLHHIAGTVWMRGYVDEEAYTKEIPLGYAEAHDLLMTELADMGYAGIVSANDSESGYEKIMAAIDNILIREEAKKKKPVVAKERELVTV